MKNKSFHKANFVYTDGTAGCHYVTCSAISGDNVAIMKILAFQWCHWDQSKTMLIDGNSVWIFSALDIEVYLSFVIKSPGTFLYVFSFSSESSLSREINVRLISTIKFPTR